MTDRTATAEVRGASPESNRDPERRTDLLIGCVGLASLGLAMLVANFFIDPLTDVTVRSTWQRRTVISIAIQFFFIQPLVLMTWLVFSADALWRRVAITASFGVALLAAWYLGLAVFFLNPNLPLRRQLLEPQFRLLPMSFLVAVAATVPFVVARWFGRFQIVGPGQPMRGPGITVRSIFLTTAVIATCLAIGNGMAVEAGPYRWQVWLRIAAIGGMTMVVSAIFYLPQVIVMMRARRFWRSWLVLQLVLASIFACAISVIAWLNSPMTSFAQTFGLSVVSFVALSILLTWFLGSLRYLGYRMKRLERGDSERSGGSG